MDTDRCGQGWSDLPPGDAWRLGLAPPAPYRGGMASGNGSVPGRQRMVEVRIRAVVAVTDEAAVLTAARTGQAGVTPCPNLAPRAPVPAAVAAVLDPAAGLLPGLRLVDRSVTVHTVGEVAGVVPECTHGGRAAYRADAAG